MRAAASGCAAAALALAPRVVQACTVCLGGESNNRTEFIISTALMTFAPFLLIGGLVYYLWRRAQQVEREASALELEQASERSQAR